MADQPSTFQERLDQARTAADPHRQFHTVRFQDGAMDFSFQWGLGYIRNGGGEIGEMFATAAEIVDADPDSWAAAWPQTAARVAAKGRAAAKRGHRVSAREFLLRASCYHRSSLAAMSPDHPEFQREYQRSFDCFAAAAALMTPPVELITVPFEGIGLPGCFIRAAAGPSPRPTFLAIGGAETFFTDLYFHIGPAALARGYNFVTIDLPGQGILPATGYHFRPDTERPIGAILDYLVNRTDVATDRIAAYGISAGGYFVPRAAANEPRIKACVANCGLPSLGRLLTAMVAAPESALSPFNVRMLQLIAWRFGRPVTDVSGMAAATAAFTVDPAEIDCPTLSICSEGEYLNPMTRELVDAFGAGLSHPRSTSLMASLADGAGTHCLGENAGLLASLVFDWLDEVFA